MRLGRGYSHGRYGVQGCTVIRCSAVGIKIVGKIGTCSSHLRALCHELLKPSPAAPVIKTRLGSEDMIKLSQVKH